MTAHCRPEHDIRPIHGRAQRHARGTTVVNRGVSSVTTTILDDEHRAFEADAKARDLSKSQLMRLLIQAHLAAPRLLLSTIVREHLPVQEQ